MGVPKFYRYISERYPCLSEVISDQEIPEFDNLYLDMNGVIHNCSHPNDDDVTFRITEEQIFQDIFAYIEKLYKMIQPQKVFMMAVDGVAPRAKMNQQRARRFMSARTAELQLRVAKANGEEIPDEKRFDSNCITPGTYFMTTLHARLADWVESKVQSDPLWQGRRIFLSGHNCPGEGEHKIMDFIRAERASPSYDPNTRHCMYGLDADLIMLGIVTHEPHFALLREEVKFGGGPKRGPKGGKKGKGVQQPPPKQKKTEAQFHLLHLSLMREYLAWEFHGLKDKISFGYDMERIADDWVLMGFLVGNDFLPHLPHINIQDDALPLLYNTYKRVLPTLSGYINEGGYLNLRRFEAFLKELGNNDRSCFMNMMADSDYLRGKQQQAPIDEELEEFKLDPDDVAANVGAIEPELLPGLDSMDEEDSDSLGSAAFISSDEDGIVNEVTRMYNAQQALLEAGIDFDDQNYDEESALADFMNTDESEFVNDVDNCWSKQVGNAFKRHKREYYQDKLNMNNINKSQLKNQGHTYVRAIQWNLHYYYHGCVSWSWYYPFHYAPYISDIVDFADLKIEFDLSKPFQPFEQLLGVLPAASSECLPPAFRPLMCDESSPIADFYPTDFLTDLNGKRNDWEAVVLIPFIDEKRLLRAMAPIMHELNKEELSRNEHGGHVLFQFDPQNAEKQLSCRSLINKDEFRIDQSKVIWGLLPNVKLDVFFSGFPTMRHLTHTGYLKKLDIQVFNAPSKKDSMVLRIQNNPKEEEDIMALAKSMLGEEVCIEWPILKLGKVVRLESQGRIYKKTEDGEVVVYDMRADAAEQLSKTIIATADKCLKRYAIELDKPTTVLVHVSRFRGMVFKIGSDENGVPFYRNEKQFESPNQTVPVLLPLVVRKVVLAGGKQFRSLPIDKAFPMRDSTTNVNKTVWVMDPTSILFGFPCTVVGYENLGKVSVFSVVTKIIEFVEEEKLIEAKSLRWNLSYQAARFATVSSGVFNQVTAHVFLYLERPQNGQPGGEKVNIGLAMKYGKREMEIPDFTRRNEYTRSDGSTGKSWLYSDLAVRLVQQYKNEFPEVIGFLDRNQDRDREVDLCLEDIWPDKTKREHRFEKLKEFLSCLPYSEVDAIDGGSDYLDRQMIALIEAKTKPDGVKLMKRVQQSVDPKYLFRRELHEKNARPNENANFRLLDRVACVNKAGSKKASGIILPTSAVINLTYERHRKTENSGTDELEQRIEDSSNRKKKQKNSKSNSQKESSGPYVPYTPKVDPKPEIASVPKQLATFEDGVNIEEKLKTLGITLNKPTTSTPSDGTKKVESKPSPFGILDVLAGNKEAKKKKSDNLTPMMTHPRPAPQTQPNLPIMKPPTVSHPPAPAPPHSVQQHQYLVGQLHKVYQDQQRLTQEYEHHREQQKRHQQNHLTDFKPSTVTRASKRNNTKSSRQWPNPPAPSSNKASSSHHITSEETRPTTKSDEKSQRSTQKSESGSNRRRVRTSRLAASFAGNNDN